MENRVLFRGIPGDGYYETKPCTFWLKFILRGKSENHGTKVSFPYFEKCPDVYSDSKCR